MSTELDILRTTIGIGLLVFTGRVLGTLCQRIKVPEVVGEVAAGAMLGPYALGQFILLFGGRPFALNDLMISFATIGGIIVLFSAGMEFTITDLRKAGVVAFAVGALGVILPFVLGYLVSVLLGLGWAVSVLVGATLTATSIAITVRVLGDLGQLKSEEGKVMVNAAMIDDVLGLAVLSVVVSVIQGNTIPTVTNVAIITAQSIAIWGVMVVGSAVLFPRIIHAAASWKSQGTIEALVISLVFGLAGFAAFAGLSPIVGAFAAGMALASSKVVQQIKLFVQSLKLVFGPLFFAVIGTYLDVTKVFNLNFLIVVAVTVTAVVGKIIGCGFPAGVLLKSKTKGWRIGIGMISRGEVGFIVAGLGLTAGILTEDVYAALILVILATTVISPVLLRRSFGNVPPGAEVESSRAV